MRIQHNALTVALSLCSLSVAWAVIGHSAAVAEPVTARPAAGEQLFRQRCQACHSLATTGAPGTLGPNLRGVVGRKAAATGFAYSPALRKSQAIWTKEALDRFLTAPGRVIPGTRMVISVPNATDRAQVIAYLEGQRASR